MTQRELAIAGMRNSKGNADEDRYVQFLLRPKQPSFLRQLALGAFSNLSLGGSGMGGSAGPVSHEAGHLSAY